MVYFVGHGEAPVTADIGTPMGGYWNRTSGTTGASDELTASVLFIRNGEQGAAPVAIVALDLVGVAHETSTKIASIVKEACGNNPAVETFVACSHTHTGPQSHSDLKGMSQGGAAYIEGTLYPAVKRAAEAAFVSAVEVTLSVGLVENVPGSVNRRQRMTEAEAKDTEADASLFWFEKAGVTKLGQREDGPCVRDGHALVFRKAEAAAGAAAAGREIVATVLHFACHPTTIGMVLEQSADFVGEARRVVAAHTSAPVLYLQGCCGDINPRHRKGGLTMAYDFGKQVGAAFCNAVDSTASPSTSSSTSLSTSIRMVRQDIQLDVEPLPSRAAASGFLSEQNSWLEKVRANRAAPGSVDPFGIPYDELAPTACIEIATRVVDAVAGSDASVADSGAPTKLTARMEVCALQLGSVVLVGLEAEPFSDYQVNISLASKFPTTLVTGYCNGCIGYLPTEAEVPYGGYECVHSHRGYNRMMPLAPTAEHQVLEAATNIVAGLAAAEEDAEKAATAAAAAATAVFEKKILATVVDSGFEYSHDTYNGVSVAKSDGKVYFAISSQERDVGGHCYSFDPTTGEQVDVGDLTEACGEDPKLQVAQGKSHVPFFENPDTGELLFGTHVGYYSEEDGMEVMARPDILPDGFAAYPGGSILSLTPGANTFKVLGKVPEQGIVTMNVDHNSGRCFVLTWPHGEFMVFDKAKEGGGGGGGGDLLVPTTIEYPGRGGGEGVHPRTGNYRCNCRTIAVVGGCAYFTNAEGAIIQWSPDRPDAVNVVLKGEAGLRRPVYLGTYDHTDAGSMSYHWRQVVTAVYKGVECVLGVHGGSGYLFAFYPPKQGTVSEGARIDLVERITSDPSRRYGVQDLFSYGYLGFALHPSGKKLFYLTGGPITLRNGERLRGKESTAKGESKGIENLHLVSYDLESDVRKDYGAIFFGNRPGFPNYVNSIAVSDDCVYALTRLGYTPDDGSDARTVLMQIKL